MANEASDNAPAGSLDGLPPGISGAYKQLQLPTSGKLVVILKWSFNRARLVMDQLTETMAGESIENLKASRGNLKETLKRILSKFGDQALEIARISVHSDHRDLVHPEMDFEDFVEVLDATLEINITERLAKKVMGLVSRVQDLLRARNASSQ